MACSDSLHEGNSTLHVNARRYKTVKLFQVIAGSGHCTLLKGLVGGGCALSIGTAGPQLEGRRHGNGCHDSSTHHGNIFLLKYVENMPYRHLSMLS